MNYSEEQKKALEIRNMDVIVSAQAGAGKTQVLVERVIRQITEENYSLENILVVTFTNKAAGELKSRIRKGLFKALLALGTEDKTKRTRLLKEITAVASASIQTLHAFCYQLIRENYDRLSLDPAVHILDPKKLDQLKEASLDKILRKTYEKKDPETLSFIENYGLTARRDDQLLRSLIVLFSEEKAKKIDGEKWIYDWLEEIGTPSYDLKFEEIYCKKFQKKLEDLAYDMEELAQKAAGMPEKYKNALMEEAISAKESLEAWKKGERKEIAFVKRMPAVGNKEGQELVELKDRLNSRRTENKALSRELFAMDFPDLKDLHRENLSMKKSLAILSSLTSLYEKELKEKKKDWEGLDFNDVEHLALELLNQKEIRDKVRKSFSLIYFDEYQDASDIQNEIIERMKNPRGLFFVGDVKQSIYGFRQACPENFQKRYKAYGAEGEKTAEALDFTVNYRSLPAILHFVNFLFIPLMTENRGRISYNSPTHLSKVQPFSKEARLSMEKGERFAGKVHVVILDKDSQEEAEENGHRENSYLNEKSAEAFYIARKIKEYVARGGHYKDCAILLRKDRGRIFEFESVLRAFQIPVHSEADSVDQEATELKIALSLLQILDNERADLALLTVLSSVVGDFSDEQLALIRVFYPQGPFYEACQHILKAEKEEREMIFSSFSSGEREELILAYQKLREKLEHFDEKLWSWRDLFSQMPLSRAIWKIFQRSGLYAFSSSLDYGGERRENLNLLLRMAENYEKEGSSDLYGFLSLVGEGPGTGRDGQKPAGAFSALDDVVQIMTIHAAKGLDFKIVFLAELGGRLRGKSQADFAAEDDLGPALTVKWTDSDHQGMVTGPSLVRKLLKEKEEQRELDEEVRILYVAMTRASQELYLTGQESLSKKKLFDPSLLEDSQKSLQKELDRATSYMQWILTVLRHDQIFWTQCRGSLGEEISVFPDQLPKRDFYGVSAKKPSSLIEIEMEKSTHYRPWDGKIDFEKAEEKGISDFDQEAFLLQKAGKDALSFQYPYLADTRRPLKETVTELAKKERLWEDPQSVKKEAAGFNFDQEDRGSFGEALKLPSFMEKEKPISPAQFGTLMHRALQSLPMKEYQFQDLQVELDELVKRELFTEEERKLLDLEMLIKFYRSEKALWLSRHTNALYRERPFTMRLKRAEGSLTLDGQIDLFVDLEKATEGREKGLLLVDYKSDRTPEKDRYQGQLALYGQALEMAFGKKVVKAYLYWIRWGKWEEVDLKINR